jgi:hypothetical protein
MHWYAYNHVGYKQLHYCKRERIMWWIERRRVG